MAKRCIAVITGTRAEYGLLFWVMKELQARDVELQVLVTGAHLSAAHGMTVRQIEADGFPIAAKIDMQLSSDEPSALAFSMGLAVAGIADALNKLKPDIVVILGDRYEMLAAASAAVMMNVPIAHIGGGETTEGAIDESLRHAITKLSYWHFVYAEPYAKRVRQMGEAKDRVFTVGATGIDQLARGSFLSRPQVEEQLGLSLAAPVLLFTYHPETLSAQTPLVQAEAVLAALRHFPEATLLITGANADAGGRVINELLTRFATDNPKSVFRMSFGSTLYLSAMRECDVVVGNSSSALIEAPVMGKVSVNIGDRQAGRMRAETVIDCACNEKAIVNAIRKALSPEWKNRKPSALFGVPGKVAPAIADALASVALPPTPRKSFHDA